MKIAELNIGLSSKTLGEISPENVLSLLKAEGFEILSFRIAESTSNDGAEKCLAVKVKLPENWQGKLSILSDYWGQDCIAVVGFIGHDPYDTFIRKHWVTPEAPKFTSKDVADLCVQGYSKKERAEILKSNNQPTN